MQSGSLVITARAEPAGSPYSRYTSARIRTAGRFAVAPSAAHPVIRVEARIKLPAGEPVFVQELRAVQHARQGSGFA